MTGDRNVWLHTTGWDGTYTGNITFTNSAITSNSGNVDVYAQYNGPTLSGFSSEITMDGNSSITATAGRVTMSASKTTTVANITASGDILLKQGLLSLETKLNVITGSAPLVPAMYIDLQRHGDNAAVTTNDGDIYLYDLGEALPSALTPEPASNSTTEIALLQAADTNALVIGRGKVYTPPANIETGIGSIPTAFNVTTAGIAQKWRCHGRQPECRTDHHWRHHPRK